MVPKVLTVLIVLAGAVAAAPKTHRLEATPTTVAYGWYDAAASPVLRITSGVTFLDKGQVVPKKIGS